MNVSSKIAIYYRSSQISTQVSLFFTGNNESVERIGEKRERVLLAEIEKRVEIDTSRSKTSRSASNLTTLGGIIIN